MKDKAILNSFSVYLINWDGYAKYKDLVVDELKKKKPIDIDGGQLFFKATDYYFPQWVNGFFGEEKLGKTKKKLRTKIVSAVYFTNIKKDGKKITFALAFGNGRYLIRPEYIKHDFGLATARHAIDPSHISSIRTMTYDSSIKDKIIRSTAEIKESEFFLNANTDALTAVSGKVRTEKTGDLLKDRTIGGKDSVLMTAYVNIDNLKVFLRQLFDQFENDGSDGVRYDSNIKKLTIEAELKKAEGLLQKVIDNYKTEENLYLNLPLERLGELNRVIGFTIGGDEKEGLTKDLLERYHTIKELKETIVTIKTEHKTVVPLNYKLYNFLYAEIENGDLCYLLVDGQFYSVSKGYKKQVDEYYKAAKMETPSCLKSWNGKMEGDFNEDQESEKVLVMDQKFVSPKKSDRFEVCDLLTLDKHFIHVKIFDVAAHPLGHLFNQGMLSAKCLCDEEIRDQIKDKIKEVQEKAGKKNDFSIPSVFKPDQYIVTFLLLCRKKKYIETNGRPIIPFLAKAVFRQNCMEIERLGYEVRLGCMTDPNDNDK